jgi:hypothetical protein
MRVQVQRRDMDEAKNKPFVYRDTLYLSGVIMLLCFLGCIYAIYTGRQNYEQLVAIKHLKPDQVAAFAKTSLINRPIYPLVMGTISVIQGLFSVVWLYFVSANTYAFGARGQRYGLDWTVGSYFVPGANFVWPYRSMNEIVLASRWPQSWNRHADSNLVAAWWAGFLLSPILWFVLPRLMHTSPSTAALTVDDLLRWNTVVWVNLPFDLLRFFFALWLTASVQFTQERRLAAARGTPVDAAA